MKNTREFEEMIEENIRAGLVSEEPLEDSRLRLIEAGIKLLAVRTRKKEAPEDEGAFFNGKPADEGRADS